MDDKILMTILLATLIPFIFIIYFILWYKGIPVHQYLLYFISFIIEIIRYIYLIISNIYKNFYIIFTIFIIILIIFIIFNAKTARYNPGGLFVNFFTMILNPIYSLIINIANVIINILEFPYFILNTFKNLVMIFGDIFIKIVSFINYISSILFFHTDDFF